MYFCWKKFCPSMIGTVSTFDTPSSASKVSFIVFSFAFTFTLQIYFLPDSFAMILAFPGAIPFTVVFADFFVGDTLATFLFVVTHLTFLTFSFLTFFSLIDFFSPTEIVSLVFDSLIFPFELISGAPTCPAPISNTPVSATAMTLFPYFNVNITSLFARYRVS